MGCAPLCTQLCLKTPSMRAFMLQKHMHRLTKHTYIPKLMFKFNWPTAFWRATVPSFSITPILMVTERLPHRGSQGTLEAWTTSVQPLWRTPPGDDFHDGSCCHKQQKWEYITSIKGMSANLNSMIWLWPMALATSHVVPFSGTIVNCGLSWHSSLQFGVILRRHGHGCRIPIPKSRKLARSIHDNTIYSHRLNSG